MIDRGHPWIEERLVELSGIAQPSALTRRLVALTDQMLTAAEAFDTAGDSKEQAICAKLALDAATLSQRTLDLLQSEAKAKPRTEDDDTDESTAGLAAEWGVRDDRES